MPLIRNTLVFLDTGFFKNYKETDRYDPDFLEYSRAEKITLCTSHICLEEWRSQKIEQLNGYLASANSGYNAQTISNPIADKILSPYPLRHPDQEEINEKSQEMVNEFVNENKIIRYMPTEKHIKRTWDAYFKWLPPFSSRKNRKDIPDSWVFEAARDARFNEEHKTLQNRFCIGGDNNLKKHLEKLGLKPITVFDLLELIRQEETGSPSDAAGQGIRQEPLPEDKSGSEGSGVIPEITALDDVLNTALNPEMREIYLRILGYTHWLSNPEKKELFSLIEGRGFDLELIKAGAVILSQKSLELIQDTGNHLLPLNNEICEEASNRVMSEIIEYLG